MFTDIVGYTALMGYDEGKALDKLRKSHQIQKDLIEKYDGKWLKEIGDGVLAEFNSALNAVECAIAIQKASEPGLVRIGIHLGDVFYEQEEIYGDGVNIASRIESEAAPGGICISETVQQNIKNQQNIKTSVLGKRKLKNVEMPLILYQVSGAGISTLSTTKSKSLSVYVVLGLIIGFSIFSGTLAWFLKPGDKKQKIEVKYFHLLTPADSPVALIGSADFGFGQPALDISPDGSAIVYAGKSGNTTQLYIRYVNDMKITALKGTEGAYYPFFSSDGQWVGFMSENKLKKVSLTENIVFSICDVTYPYGAVWLPDDEIIFADNQGIFLKKVSSSGGIPEVVGNTRTNPQLTGWFLYPQLLPGAKEIICNVGNRGIIIVYSLETKEVIQIEGIRGYSPHYLSTGHIACIVEDVLVTIPFNLNAKEIAGNLIPVEEPVRSESTRPGGQFAVSQNGRLAYIPGLSAGIYKFLWVSRKGEIMDTVNLPANNYGEFRLSYDGQKIAYPLYPDIWIYDVVDNTRTRISSKGENYRPHWSATNQTIVYTSNREGIEKTYQRSAGGLGTETPFIDIEKAYLVSLSRDAKNAILNENEKILIFDLNRNEKTYLPPDLNSTQIDISPDGKYFLYLSDETGEAEVYVREFPLTDNRWNVSHGYGVDPIWSLRGDEIFFRRQNQWYSVKIDTSNSFQASTPEFLFEGNYIDIGGKSFAVSPDGERFLVLDQVNQERYSEVIVFVDNWFEMIKGKSTE